jgi:hypothetical protein
MNDPTPQVMRELIDVAGADAAWAIARAHGGTTVYIPAHASADHWLTELVGFTAATKICDHYRVANTGIRLLIPIAKQAAQRQRLVKALEQGLSAPDAASAAGMHERSAFRARRRLARKNGNQGSLF